VKLLRRARTWISVVLTCALPFVVAVFVSVTHLVPPPGQGSAFLSAVLQDGALYPAAALALVLPVFLPVAVAVVAGGSSDGGAGGGRGRHVAVRRAAQPAPADRTDGGSDRLHHRVDARRGRDRAVPVDHHRFGPRLGARRAGRARGQRGAGHAQRGHRGPA